MTLRDETQPAPPYRRASMSKAEQDVLAERRRQVEVEGWDHAHDDEEHPDGQLAMAGACYAAHSEMETTQMWRMLWPWDGKWWKPKDRRSDLVRAAALLIAEIERIDRAALQDQQESSDAG